MKLEKNNFDGSSDFIVDDNIPHITRVNIIDRSVSIEFNGSNQSEKDSEKTRLISKGFIETVGN